MDPLQAKANYFRVCQLLIDKGGDALRRVLQTRINISPSPSTLKSLLNAHKKSLQKIRYSVINATQWKLLFPPSGSPDSNNFDISLLTILLRNICGLSSPAAGWNVLPPASDTSVSAEILRIKMIRNEVYGHISSAQLGDTKFETLWREISQPLIKLGILQKDIDQLKQTALSPEEESYIEKLKQWKELEDTLCSKLDDIEKEVAKLRGEIVKSRKIEDRVTSEISKLAKFVFLGKIEELSDKFQAGTRKWFFHDFKEWLDDETSRIMILTAGPGVGKSVLSARICELYEESGQLAACHFCDFRTSDYRDPHRILQSLASQMCDNVHGFRDKLTEALSREHSRNSLYDTFRVLLNDPLHALDRTEPMLIVVDALDESKTPVKSELLDLISDQFSQLPKWIKIFISSRPELQVREKLQHLNPVEIRPDDDKHNLDLKQFIECYFTSINKSTIESLVSKCQGSFLYAYYLMKVEVNLGSNPNVNVHISKGISGFYEKQFERLKKDLQCYEQETGVSIFKNFINVVAASKQPLPFRLLFACMDMSSEQFEVRKTIVGIMSEILPVYDDCLTVFHKSLWDWLKLDGYEEHAHAADVADGKKRLWRACKKVYTDIDSLSLVSDLQISPEKRYALENGVKYFVNVDGAEDWEWLVNVKVIYFQLGLGHRWYQRRLATRLLEILQEYNLTIPVDLFWHLFLLYTFIAVIIPKTFEDIGADDMYLQYFANMRFSWVQDTTTSNMVARKMLDETNTIWLEEVTNEADSCFSILYRHFFRDDSRLEAISASPDNKLLVMRNKEQVKVYELPYLEIIFKLDLDNISRHDCPYIAYSSCITFYPDSSYFLFNSLQTCVSIKNQSIVPFIPHGPAEILSSSFSSCGTKLVSAEKQSIKVWDVIKKELLTESRHDFDLVEPITCFSSCESYIFLFESRYSNLNVFDSTTLNALDISRIDTSSTKLDNSVQLISPPSCKRSNAFCPNIECWQLTTGENILCTSEYCSAPFVWKGKKCVMISSCELVLVVYDYFNQQIIDTFQISCLPICGCINYIAYLEEDYFLIYFEDNFVFLLSLESSSESFSFINDVTYPIFCALSPDNFHVACSYGSPILKIINVDNGETLQTVAPKLKPIACWWSELYLWVVCEGLVVIKYPYTLTCRLTHKNVVGNYVEECSFDCDGEVLEFEEGVLVCHQVNGKISISKIFHENLSQQQTLDSKVEGLCSVAISSDGCAVLLYDTDNSYAYELWEMGSENEWGLHSAGKLNPLTTYGQLSGEQNSRSLLWLLNPVDYWTSDSTFVDSSDTTQKGVVWELPIELSHDIFHSEVIYVNSENVICHSLDQMYFISFSRGIVKYFYTGPIKEFFFVPSKRLIILFIGNGIIKHFKIHNIDEYLLSK